MKTQIKKWGDSNVLILSPEFMKYHGIKAGDWVDLSDIIILSDELHRIKNEVKDE